MLAQSAERKTQKRLSRRSNSAIPPKSWTSMRRLARTMRFHLDEHLPHAIAEGLRRHGIDVTTTVEAGLFLTEGLSHETQLLSRYRLSVYRFIPPPECGKP